MAVNVAAAKRGWRWDGVNEYMSCYVNGVEAFRVDNTGANGYFRMYNATETQSDPGRQIRLDRTHTGTIGDGKTLSGLDVSSTWQGNANCTSSEIKGAEFKARGDSTGTYSMGNMRAIVGNLDAKKTDVDGIARVMELVFENQNGSTCATVYGIDVKLQASGVMTASYVAYFHGHSASYADYGVYIQYVKRPFYAAGTLSGSSAIRAFEMAITDATTQSSGYNAAFFVEVTNTGAMTPTEYSAGRFNLILNTGTKTGLMCALKAKIGTGAAPTLSSADLIGLEISMDEMGSTSSYSCLWLETYQTTTVSESFFIWCKSQGLAQLDAVIGVWGNYNPTFFIRTQGFQAGFYDQGGVAGDQCIGHIACEFADTTGYINVYSDNS